MRKVFPDATLRMSCVPRDTVDGRRRTRAMAGTLVGTHSALLGRGVSQEQVPTPPALHGYLTHVRLSAPGAPAARHCLSIYLPPEATGGRRLKVLGAMRSHLASSLTAHPNDWFLVGGDFNGVTAAADRSSGALTAADARLVALLEEFRLVSVFSRCTDPRPHSHFSTGSSARLDDFLCKHDDPLLAALALGPQTAGPDVAG